MSEVPTTNTTDTKTKEYLKSVTIDVELFDTVTATATATNKNEKSLSYTRDLSRFIFSSFSTLFNKRDLINESQKIKLNKRQQKALNYLSQESILFSSLPVMPILSLIVEYLIFPFNNRFNINVFSSSSTSPITPLNKNKWADFIYWEDRGIVVGLYELSDCLQLVYSQKHNLTTALVSIEKPTACPVSQCRIIIRNKLWVTDNDRELIDRYCLLTGIRLQTVGTPCSSIGQMLYIPETDEVWCRQNHWTRHPDNVNDKCNYWIHRLSITILDVIDYNYEPTDNGTIVLEKSTPFFEMGCGKMHHDPVSKSVWIFNYNGAARICTKTFSPLPTGDISQFIKTGQIESTKLMSRNCGTVIIQNKEIWFWNDSEEPIIFSSDGTFLSGL
jgi:hypothetical protein